MQEIQFLLGHASVQTTERYLGCKQNTGHPVNDLFSLTPESEARAESTVSPSLPLPSIIGSPSVATRMVASDSSQPLGVNDY